MSKAAVAARVDYERLSRKALNECVGATGMRWPLGCSSLKVALKLGWAVEV